MGQKGRNAFRLIAAAYPVMHPSYLKTPAGSDTPSTVPLQSFKFVRALQTVSHKSKWCVNFIIIIVDPGFETWYSPSTYY